MKAVYKLKVYKGYGTLSGVFVATKEDVEDIMGQTVYFGEALGKHSEVEADMDESTIILVSDDPVVVTMVEDLGLESGYNPFNYWEPEEEEENEDLDEDGLGTLAIFKKGGMFGEDLEEEGGKEV